MKPEHERKIQLALLEAELDQACCEVGALKANIEDLRRMLARRRRQEPQKTKNRGGLHLEKRLDCVG